MMRVVETVQDADAYEQRYSIKLLGTPLRFVRRPITIQPPEGTVCFVDNGPRFGRIQRRSAATFKGGKWSRVPFEPTHWTDWEGGEQRPLGTGNE